MSLVDARAALENALNAITPAIETHWENLKFVPTVGTPYQSVHLTAAEPSNLEYGPNYKEMGVLQIALMYPTQTGNVAAVTRAELIRATFTRAATFTKNSTTVIIQRTPQIMSGNVVNDRYRLPVLIRWFTNQ